MAYPRREHYTPPPPTCPFSFHPSIPPIATLKQWHKEESKGKSQIMTNKLEAFFNKGQASFAQLKASKNEEVILCNDKLNTMLKNDMQTKLDLNEYINNYKPESTTIKTEFDKINNDPNNYQETKTAENKLKAYAKRYASLSKKELRAEKDKLDKLSSQNDKLSKEIEFRYWLARAVAIFEVKEWPEKVLYPSNKIIVKQQKMVDSLNERNRALATEVVTSIPVARAGKWAFKSGKWVKKKLSGKSKAKLRPKANKGKPKINKTTRAQGIRDAAKARKKQLGSIGKRTGQQLLTTKKLKVLYGLAIACAINYIKEKATDNIPGP